MKYKHVTTVTGLRKVESVAVDYPQSMLEVTLEDDLADHVVCLDYNDWNGKIKLGDGMALMVELIEEKKPWTEDDLDKLIKIRRRH